MLPGKHKIRVFPLFEDLMSSVSKITASQIARIYRKLPLISPPAYMTPVYRSIFLYI